MQIAASPTSGLELLNPLDSTPLGVGPQLAADVSGEAQRFLVQVLMDEVLQARQLRGQAQDGGHLGLDNADSMSLNAIATPAAREPGLGDSLAKPELARKFHDNA